MKKLINLFLGRYLRRREIARHLALSSLHAVRGDPTKINQYFNSRDHRWRRFNATHYQ